MGVFLLFYCYGSLVNQHRVVRRQRQMCIIDWHEFGLANLVGVIALSYGAILALTSNEAVFWCWACGIFVNFRVFDDLVKEPKT